MDRQLQEEGWTEAAGRPGGVAKYVLRLLAREPQMHATRWEGRASRTCGSQLVAFLNVPPSLASTSQSLLLMLNQKGRKAWRDRGSLTGRASFKQQDSVCVSHRLFLWPSCSWLLKGISCLFRRVS